MKEEIIIEEKILFTDKKFFGDNEEHEYDCKCKDGIAMCERVGDDENEPLSIIVEYPTLSGLTDKQKDHILEYRGLYDLTHKDIHYGDVMVVYGKIKY